MTTEQINNGILEKEYIKYNTGFFCDLVYSELQKTKDVFTAYITLAENIVAFSNARTNLDNIRPIDGIYDILTYFFNQKNEIPIRVCYWLQRYYLGGYREITYYAPKHMAIYNDLQKIFIHHYRWRKRDAKENAQYYRQRLRRISKMYRSGNYTATFKLYNTPLENAMDLQELSDVPDMLRFLFGKQINSNLSGYDELAIGYILGRIQGRSEICA